MFRSRRRSTTIPPSSGSDPGLVALLGPERVLIPLASREKSGILGELSRALAAGLGVPERAGDILAAVLARESVLSTGIGHRVGLPHARTEAIDRLALAVGIAPGPVDFEALDREPVDIVWLLAGPPSAAGLHVRTLARVTELMRREAARARLLAAATPAEFLSRLAEEDSA